MNAPSTAQKGTPPAAIAEQFAVAKAAQLVWASTPLTARLQLVRRLRNLIATRASALGEVVAQAAARSIAEALAAQLLPLADACRFLEKRALQILATNHLGSRGRPGWLFGVESEIRREPCGVILIIAPSNYPLLLPGVQALQALVAGNAVLLKPGARGGASAQALQALFTEAGLDSDLLTVLPESVEAAREALALPVSKVVFTGSFEVGTKVLAALADRAIPCVAELSGCDAVFIRDDADLALAVRALVFGLRFNGSATCIAPRRVFIARRIAERFEAMLCDALVGASFPASDAQHETLMPLLREALENGASILTGGMNTDGALMLPCVLGDAKSTLQIMRTAYFAPVLCVTATDSDEHALALAAECPFELGATIFSHDLVAARALASRIRAGCVLINDLIVPTADPRLPFGGRGRSGFGLTRGAEGLLEMTNVKTVQVRTGRAHQHFDPPREDDESFFRRWIEAAHGGGARFRSGAGWGFLRAILKRAGKS